MGPHQHDRNHHAELEDEVELNEDDGCVNEAFPGALNVVDESESCGRG